MARNSSPWIAELDSSRVIDTLHEDLSRDVAVVGAGIAGISTALFLLEHTSAQVLVLEKYTLASGASGHNAGLAIAVFERPYAELEEEFGTKLTQAVQKEVESGWELLEHLCSRAEGVQMVKVLGMGGLRTLEDCVTEMEDIARKRKAGFSVDSVLIAHDAPYLASIPDELKGCYEVRDAKEIRALLHTPDAGYHAALPNMYGIVNSALLCEKLVEYMKREYSDRFRFVEHSNVSKIVLKKDMALLDVLSHTVTARRVVLCTNGFRDMHIFNNTSGLDIDTTFHHNVSGKIGYMAAYKTPEQSPAALWYDVDANALSSGNPEDGFKEIDAFLYLSRRAHADGSAVPTGLVSIGGPDVHLSDHAEYSPDMAYPSEVKNQILEYVRRVCGADIQDEQLAFTWHGLMGYTPTGIRRVGVEPRNPVLLYNLGCNGIGILPSVAGGRRIARLVAGEELPPSLFDPEKIA